MRYRRAKVPGGTYFFTVALADRSQCLLTEHITALRRCHKVIGIGDAGRNAFELKQVTDSAALKKRCQLIGGNGSKNRH